MSKQIALTKGMFTTVDDEDYEWLNHWKWHCHCGYARRVQRIDGKYQTIHMSREILNCPEDKVADHINRDKLDNQRSNLRAITFHQNLFNKDSYSGSSSTYKGVRWSKKSSRWEANIKFFGKTTYLGSFLAAEDAAAVYNEKAKEIFGEFCALNPDTSGATPQRFLKAEKCACEYRGVTWHKKNKKWASRITVDGKRMSLGYFTDAKQAAEAYNLNFEKYHGKKGPNRI